MTVFDEPPLAFRWAARAWVWLGLAAIPVIYLDVVSLSGAGGRVAVLLGCVGVGLSLVLLVWLRRLLWVREPLRLTPQGFEARGWGLPFIPWTGVVETWVDRGWGFNGPRPALCLRLLDPAGLHATLPWHRRLLLRGNAAAGYGDVSLGAEWLVPDLDALVRYAERARRAVHDRGHASGGTVAPPGATGS